MPPLNELPGEIKRNKFIKVLRKLGFDINEKGGNGSHYKATWSRTQKFIIIPKNLYKQTLIYVINEIEKYSGLTWDDIKKEL